MEFLDFSSDCSLGVGLGALTNSELVNRLRNWVCEEREATAEVIALLVELDRRKVWAEVGFASLYAYATGGLGYAEAAAFRRIRVARLVTQGMPQVLEALQRGRVHLSGLCALAPVLTRANVSDWLARAEGCSKREIEEMVAAAHPQKLGEGERRLVAKPLGRADGVAGDVAPPEERVYRVSFAVSGTFLEKFERAKELLSHAEPDGDAEAILGRALDVLIAHTEKRRFATTTLHGAATQADSSREEQASQEEGSRPMGGGTPADSSREELASQPGESQPGESQPGAGPEGAKHKRRSRNVPRDVRRQVYERDEGKCCYMSPDGKACGSRRHLELHHRRAWARGGANTAENLEVRCRAHNGLASLFEYGPAMAEFWARRWLARQEARRAAEEGAEAGGPGEEPGTSEGTSAGTSAASAGCAGA